MKITIAGLSMNYVERGTPGGIPIVFVHGFPFNLETWEPQMRALPNQFRAIAYDVRGHGKSDVGDGQYSLEFFVDDLIALLDHLVIDKAVICGLSMGGYIALRALERQANRFKGLILCDTKSGADSNDGRVKRAASLKAVKTNGVDQFAESFVKSVLCENTIRNNPTIAENVRAIIKGNSPMGIGGTLLALACRTDTTSSLQAITCPTLILCGEYDTLTPPAESEAMNRLIKGSAFYVIPDAAHLSNLENPASFNDKLIPFVKSIH